MDEKLQEEIFDESEEQTKVLIKINDNNEITEIGSSVFISKTTDYIEIDNGTGDKYAHAQKNYLEKSLIDEYGRYNYKYSDGEVIEVEHGEYVEEIVATELETVQAEVDLIKLELGLF